MRVHAAWPGIRNWLCFNDSRRDSGHRCVFVCATFFASFALRNHVCYIQVFKVDLGKVSESSSVLVTGGVILDTIVCSYVQGSSKLFFVWRHFYHMESYKILMSYIDEWYPSKLGYSNVWRAVPRDKSTWCWKLIFDNIYIYIHTHIYICIYIYHPCHQPGDLLPESIQRYGMRTFIQALMVARDVPKEAVAQGTWWLLSKFWKTYTSNIAKHSVFDG
jgi:hypothetical protein